MSSSVNTALDLSMSGLAPKRGRFSLACAIGVCALLLLSPAAAQQGTATNDPGSVENATFTSGIDNGAPVDFRQEFDANTRVIYFYTEVVGLPGQTVTHRWKREGKVVREVAFPVKSARQAIWSKSQMKPEWTGDWTVEVVNERGEVIGEQSFSYTPPL